MKQTVNEVTYTYNFEKEPLISKNSLQPCVNLTQLWKILLKSTSGQLQFCFLVFGYTSLAKKVLFFHLEFVYISWGEFDNNGVELFKSLVCNFGVFNLSIYHSYQRRCTKKCYRNLNILEYFQSFDWCTTSVLTNFLAKPLAKKYLECFSKMCSGHKFPFLKAFFRKLCISNSRNYSYIFTLYL